MKIFALVCLFVTVFGKSLFTFKSHRSEALRYRDSKCKIKILRGGGGGGKGGGCGGGNSVRCLKWGGGVTKESQLKLLKRGWLNFQSNYEKYMRKSQWAL